MNIRDSILFRHKAYNMMPVRIKIIDTINNPVPTINLGKYVTIPVIRYSVTGNEQKIMLNKSVSAANGVNILKGNSVIEFFKRRLSILIESEIVFNLLLPLIRLLKVIGKEKNFEFILAICVANSASNSNPLLKRGNVSRNSFLKINSPLKRSY